MRNTAILVASCVILATAPLAGQTVVSSFPVMPAGTAFVGGLELDCSNNIVWIGDETNNLISAYDTAGFFLKQYAAPIPPNSALTDPQPIGIGQDPTTGMLWIGDEGEFVYEYDPRTGVPTGISWPTTPAITDVSGVAVDPLTGHIFVSQDSGTRMIVEFDQAGTVINTINLTASGSTDPDGLAYDAVSNTFYLGDDTADTVYQVDNTGALLNSWSGFGVSPEGLGVDGANGLLYIGDGFVTRQVFVVSGIVPPNGICFPSPPMFDISVTTAGMGAARASLANIPPGTVQGWTLFTMDTSTPVGGGPIFGATPDATTFLIFSLAPVATPGNIFHWTWPVTAIYPAVPFNLPTGTLSAFAGMTWDFVGVALDATGTVTPTFNVSRVTW